MGARGVDNSLHLDIPDITGDCALFIFTDSTVTSYDAAVWCRLLD